jgi:mono/diheme cytochrome c family protein
MSSVLVAAGAARGSDSTRKYGSSDGEIFTIVRNGVKQTSMRGYAGRMTIQELWSLVNYLRSLGPSTNTSQ